MSRHSRGEKVDVVLKCAAGLEDVVARAAASDCRGLRVAEVESGFVRAGINRQSLGRVLRLPYATWTGVGLASVRKRKPTKAISAIGAVDAKELGDVLTPKRRLSFRFRCLDDNKLIAVDGNAVRAAAQVIERRNRLFRYDPRDAHVEIWILRRRGNAHFEGFARRVVKRRSTRGALDDDVAAALVRVFDPAPDDIFLDPFAGLGTIPAARSRYPATWIGACDISPPKKPLVPVERADFFSQRLDRYLDGRKPKIVVTDLPWGHHEESLDVGALYHRISGRLTEIGGSQLRCALLVGRDMQLVERLTSWLSEVHEPRTVLIHGRKATLVTGTTDSVS